MKHLLILLAFSLFLFSCNKTEMQEPQLIFKFRFDPDQTRLSNVGEPSIIPPGHGAQTPSFNTISAHYIELAPSALTQLGKGEVLYKNEETTTGGALAIDFSKAIIVKEGEVFLSIPLSSITAGSYEWLRTSLSYQNFDILLDAKVNNIELTDIPATAASFIGYNTYIGKYRVKDESITVNGNKLQGYVGVETAYSLSEFQAPPGATTVPNPIFSTSPIPQGSCVVTGKFDSDLIITGEETEDITITMSLSINKSFEWEDGNANGKYEPLLNENVVDMGIRGMQPLVN